MYFKVISKQDFCNITEVKNRIERKNTINNKRNL